MYAFRFHLVPRVVVILHLATPLLPPLSFIIFLPFFVVSFIFAFSPHFDDVSFSSSTFSLSLLVLVASQACLYIT